MHPFIYGFQRIWSNFWTCTTVCLHREFRIWSRVDPKESKIGPVFCRSTLDYSETVAAHFQIVLYKQKMIQSSLVQNSSDPVPCKHIIAADEGSIARTLVLLQILTLPNRHTLLYDSLAYDSIPQISELLW